MDHSFAYQKVFSSAVCVLLKLYFWGTEPNSVSISSIALQESFVSGHAFSEISLNNYRKYWNTQEGTAGEFLTG